MLRNGSELVKNTIFKELEKEEKRSESSIFWKLYYKLRDILWRIIYFDIFNPFRAIKWFVQRGYRGFSNSDTWDLHVYLSKIISKGVEHLRVNTHGYPGNLTEKKWDNILKEIVHAYKLIYECSAGDKEFYREDLEKRNPKLAKSVGMISKEEQAIIDKGRKLFERHFFSLWD